MGSPSRSGLPRTPVSPRGGNGEPPKNRTGLIIGLVVLALIVIGGVVIAIATVGGGETFCDRFEKNANNSEFDDIGPGDSQRLIDELETFKDLAPDELKVDYDQLIDAAKGNPSPTVETAVQNIQAYAVDNCDVSLDTPAS
ncbi:MAG: hypothetical protein H0U36_06755 [Nocardioidaceae bacterium]|nr:hypothetical protein [Nocardioidaceae bacterium]